MKGIPYLGGWQLGDKPRPMGRHIVVRNNNYAVRLETRPLFDPGPLRQCSQ